MVLIKITLNGTDPINEFPGPLRRPLEGPPQTEGTAAGLTLLSSSAVPGNRASFLLRKCLWSDRNSNNVIVQ